MNQITPHRYSQHGVRAPYDGPKMNKPLEWTICGLMLVGGGFAIAYLLWFFLHLMLPGGAQDLFDLRKAEMAEAHRNGQHAEFIRLYETPIVVPIFNDVDLEDRLSREERFMAAESYLMVGNHDEARHHLLEILGWDSLEYDSYCLLTGANCQDVELLHRLALTQRGD